MSLSVKGKLAVELSKFGILWARQKNASLEEFWGKNAILWANCRKHYFGALAAVFFDVSVILQLPPPPKKKFPPPHPFPRLPRTNPTFQHPERNPLLKSSPLQRLHPKSFNSS